MQQEEEEEEEKMKKPQSAFTKQSWGFFLFLWYFTILIQDSLSVKKWAKFKFMLCEKVV